MIKYDKKWTFILLAILMVFFLAGCSKEDGEETRISISFDTTTLEGEQIDSSVFQSYDLTMINFWATWCGPCVNEMPALGTLAAQLPENINLLGFCLDAGDPDSRQIAFEIIEQTGADYLHLLPDQSFSFTDLIPTTIFVDQNGSIVGEILQGYPPNVDLVEYYTKEMNARLELLP